MFIVIMSITLYGFYYIEYNAIVASVESLFISQTYQVVQNIINVKRADFTLSLQELVQSVNIF